MSAAPQQFRWDGEGMVPLRPRLADREFVVGEVYPLVVEHGRSGASHRHYFAQINDAWLNLPPQIAAHQPTAEHLRKFALIMTGYEDRVTHVCGSKAEAQRLRAFIAPLDDFAVIDVTEATVTVRRAKSQSVKAMGRADFQKSKDDVLGYVAEMIGVAPSELGRAA